METSVKQRLMQFIQHRKISVRAFERSIGASNGFVNGIRKTIAPDKLEQISLQFPELNIQWLIMGEGHMIKSMPERVLEGVEKINLSGVDINASVITKPLTDEERLKLAEFAKDNESLRKRVADLEKMVAMLEELNMMYKNQLNNK